MGKQRSACLLDVCVCIHLYIRTAAPSDAWVAIYNITADVFVRCSESGAKVAETYVISPVYIYNYIHIYVLHVCMRGRISPARCYFYTETAAGGNVAVYYCKSRGWHN